MKEKFKRFFIKDDVKVYEKENEGMSIPEKEEQEPCTEESDHGSLSEYTLGEIIAIRDKTGRDDILTDILSEEFAVFSEGRAGGLEEKYMAFVRLKAVMNMADTVQEKTARGESGQDGRMHSGFSGAMFKDASSGLTKRQMDMARSAGISFREYEELLNSAPVKAKNKF